MFSWLLGNSKAAETVVDGVSNGLDAMFFTDEEKSQANQKVLDFKIEYAKHTQNQSIARRVIAFIVSGVWGLLSLLVVVAGYFDRSKGSFAEFVSGFMAENIHTPFMIVLGFYFAAHVAGKLKG